MSPIDPSYVDVAERIRQFYERFPDGSLVRGGDPFTMTIAGKDFVVVEAFAYRTPEDTVPGYGIAWEPVPGPTNFTRDSELMNAQTSAWGRAIVSLGFETKHIASAEDVRNREATDRQPEEQPKAATTAQVEKLIAALRKEGIPQATIDETVQQKMSSSGGKLPAGWVADETAKSLKRQEKAA